MRARRREINIFNMSLLDILCGALGAFCFMMLVALPYYIPPGSGLELRKAQEETNRLLAAVGNMKERLPDQKSVEEMEALMRQLEAQVKSLQGRLNILTAENGDLRARVKKMAADYEDLLGEANELKADKLLLAQVNNELHAKNKTLKNANEKLTQSFNEKRTFAVIARDAGGFRDVRLLIIAKSAGEQGEKLKVGFKDWLTGRPDALDAYRDFLSRRGVAVRTSYRGKVGSQYSIYVLVSATPIDHGANIESLLYGALDEGLITRLPAVTLPPERSWALLGTVTIDENYTPVFKEASPAERDAEWIALTGNTPPATPSPTLTPPPPDSLFKGSAEALAKEKEIEAKFARLGGLRVSESGKDDAEILSLTDELIKALLILARPIHLVADPQAGVRVIIQSSGVPCLSVQSKDVTVENVRFVCNGIGQLATISVTEGAELQLDNCQVQTPTSFGVSLLGKATFKATSSTFTAAQGTAVRLDRGAEATLSQCTLANSRYALYAGGGARLALRSCAFQRNGDNGHGILFVVNGEGTEVTADDCQFEGNSAGAVIGQKASIKITNSRFKGNGAGDGGGKSVEGLLSVRFGSRATLQGDTFEGNRQGVYIADESSIEMSKCQFAGNGVQGRQLIPGAFPLSVSGQNSSAVIRETTFADSLQFAMEVRGGAKLTLEKVEITGTHDAGLIVGDRNGPPATAEIKHSHIKRNLTGIGIFGGSSATIDDCECLENQQGIVIFDRGSQLAVGKTQFIGNTDYGLRAYDGAQATATDCDFRNNATGVISGTRGKPAGRASITLETCRFGGNRAFGAGAAAQSELILTNCAFDGSDKLNVFKEQGASIQTDGGSAPAPSGGESPATPSPKEPKRIPQLQKKAQAQPHPPAPDDLQRLIRRFLPGNL